MKKTRKIHLGIFIAFGISANANSFTLINFGKDLSWQMPMRVVFNPDNCPLEVEEMEEQLEIGIAIWNSLDSTTVDIIYEGRTTATYDDYAAGVVKSPVHIFCDANFYEHGLYANVAATTIAIGLPGSFGTGERQDGFIAINVDETSTNALSEAPHLYGAVFAHELGHVLGLGHTDEENSIMNPVLQANITISQDDIEAVRSLYPAKSNPADLFSCSADAHALTKGKNSSPRKMDLFFIVFGFIVFFKTLRKLYRKLFKLKGST